MAAITIICVGGVAFLFLFMKAWKEAERCGWWKKWLQLFSKLEEEYNEAETEEERKGAVRKVKYLLEVCPYPQELRPELPEE